MNILILKAAAEALKGRAQSDGREEISTSDPSRGARFEQSFGRELQVEIVLHGAFNQSVQLGIRKRTPPFLFGGSHRRRLGLQGSGYIEGEQRRHEQCFCHDYHFTECLM